MLVRATQFGFYKQKRKPGDVFEFDGNPSCVWMEPVDDDAREAWRAAGFKLPAEEGIQEAKDNKKPPGSNKKPSPSPKDPASSKDPPPATGGDPPAGGSTGDQEVI